MIAWYTSHIAVLSEKALETHSNCLVRCQLRSTRNWTEPEVTHGQSQRLWFPVLEQPTREKKQDI